MVDLFVIFKYAKQSTNNLAIRLSSNSQRNKYELC